MAPPAALSGVCCAAPCLQWAGRNHGNAPIGGGGSLLAGSWLPASSTLVFDSRQVSLATYSEAIGTINSPERDGSVPTQVRSQLWSTAPGCTAHSAQTAPLPCADAITLPAGMLSFFTTDKDEALYAAKKMCSKCSGSRIRPHGRRAECGSSDTPGQAAHKHSFESVISRQTLQHTSALMRLSATCLERPRALVVEMPQHILCFRSKQDLLGVQFTKSITKSMWQI